MKKILGAFLLVLLSAVAVADEFNGPLTGTQLDWITGATSSTGTPSYVMRTGTGTYTQQFTYQSIGECRFDDWVKSSSIANPTNLNNFTDQSFNADRFL